MLVVFGMLTVKIRYNVVTLALINLWIAFRVNHLIDRLFFDPLDAWNINDWLILVGGFITLITLKASKTCLKQLN